MNKMEENYYKILGTTAKIGQGRIREKYIAAVKKHPPETDPEMFEKIREAYETLKDPVKRNQYDMMRKYGHKMEGMFEKAARFMEKGQPAKARKLFEELLHIAPGNFPSLVGLLQLDVLQGDLELARNHFDELLKVIPEEEGHENIYGLKAHILLEHGYYEEALEMIEEIESKLELLPSTLLMIRVSSYMFLDKFDKALNVFRQISLQIEEPDDTIAEMFMAWTDLIVLTEKWSHQTQLHNEFKKFVRSWEDEAGKADLSEWIEAEYLELMEHHHYQGAEVYLGLALLLDGGNGEIRDNQQYVKKMARIERELHRLERDDRAFPLLYIRSMEWFYEGTPIATELRQQIPRGFLEQLEEAEEDYAVGILYLQKKYPLLYKHFKENWDVLFQDLTAGFNREMKRMLKKFK